MEREQLQNLYMAIKSDDEKSFTSLMLSKSDLNISFGRFPILSLCYLYKSVKILRKYEKLLMPISKFEVVYEYFDIYKDFKQNAKRSLRLYACKEKVIYPIEMIAVLDERETIKHRYKFLFKNEEILENLQKIYNLNQKIEIIATRDKFVCKPKKISFKQKILSGVLAFVFCVLSVFSFVSINIIKNTFGLGTADSPIYISSEQEFVTAMKKGSKYYVLEKDIVLSQNVYVNNFSGTLEGGDNTLYLANNQAASMIKNLSGNIKNVNFEFLIENAKFSSSVAILAENNTGIIDNCSFSGKILASVEGTTDLFVTGVAVKNKGTISNSVVNLEATISNLAQTNAYLSAFVGVNEGVISNSSVAENKFVSNTVDLAGFAAENYGTISNVVSDVSLEQTSSKEWHPNCAGIVMINYGTIDGATNNAKITSISTATTVPEGGELHVYAGGIACNNYKIIKNCKNNGEISGSGKVSIPFVGGISAMNIVDEKYSVDETNTLICVVENSKSICDLKSFSESARAYAGGVVAVNNTQVIKCGFEGSIYCDSNLNSTDDFNVYAGGIAGFSNECVVQKCYANVEFKNKPEAKDGVVKVYGGVIGYMGFAYRYFMTQVMAGSGFNYILDNHYVENESVEYAAYGQVQIIDIVSQTSTFEAIAADEYHYTKHESVDTIPSEVRANA